MVLKILIQTLPVLVPGQMHALSSLDINMLKLASSSLDECSWQEYTLFEGSLVMGQYIVIFFELWWFFATKQTKLKNY